MSDFPEIRTMAFETACERITKIYGKYSIRDVATSLFVSCLWLPNNSSQVKHQFLTAIFVSMDRGNFTQKDQIGSYGDFRELMKALYEYFPDFRMVEDYIPEFDWGDIKFYHEGYSYRIFYGTDIENVYDYLAAYQITHCTFDDKFRAILGRSPAKELKQCLMLQDAIISGIAREQQSYETSHITPGYIEIPKESFWQEASKIYPHIIGTARVSEQFLQSFSIDIGNTSMLPAGHAAFLNLVMSGKLLPYFFAKSGPDYYPILPRRYSSILFDVWGAIYKANYDGLKVGPVSPSMQIGSQLHSFLKGRIRESRLYPMVSAVRNETPHDTLFSSGILSGDDLILVYVTTPHISQEQIGPELEKIAKGLEEASNLIKVWPSSLALHLERRNIEFRSDDKDRWLNPEIFVVIPQLATENDIIPIPTLLPGHVISMDQFVGLMDELEDVNELSTFLDFLRENDNKLLPMATVLDKFHASRLTHGILIDGAQEPDGVLIDPHGGSKLRYESLSNFWKLFPERGFVDHPRSWRVKKESATSVRLETKGYLGGAIFFKIGSIDIFLCSPFHNMTHEQAKITNLLMECLEYSMSDRQNILSKHCFFQSHDRICIYFFPSSLVSENPQFRHLAGLVPSSGLWRSDNGFEEPGRRAIRIVFDDNKLSAAFLNAKDRSLEVGVVLEVIKQIDLITPDQQISKIMDDLARTKDGIPRFGMSYVEKGASFPDFVHEYAPTPTHFKRARKCIAKLAERLEIGKGFYELSVAHGKIKALICACVAEIDREVLKFRYDESLKFLITRIDALTHKNERESKTVEISVGREVDYDRAERYSKQNSRFINMHRNYRYLIEKFVQLHPSGGLILDSGQFQYLIALIDWLHVFYSASDSLRYDILVTGMKVDGWSLVSIEYGGDIEFREKIFGEERASLDLNMIGKPNDRVNAPRDIQKFLDELDVAFRTDLGFGLKNMVNLLQILSLWPKYLTGKEESTYYLADLKTIETICIRGIPEFDATETAKILEFLLLREADILHIIDQDAPADDVPVWEHNKRPARYTLRPLIMIGDRYCWGPHSTRKSAMTWSGSPSKGAMPYTLDAPNINRVLETEKRLIGDALVDKGIEIVARFTPHYRKNCDLYKIDKLARHPIELGDYDILAFLPKKNVILNIECKDILQAHCMKDARRLRDKIFGRPGKNDGHIEKIDRRQVYLSHHVLSIAHALNWPVDDNNSPRVLAIYLTRRHISWLRFPPEGVDIKFLRIDFLHEFIESI